MTSRRLTLLLSVTLAAGCTNGIGANPGDPNDPATSVGEKLLGSGPFGLHPVPAPTPKAPGVSSPNVLPPELIESPVAQGSVLLENPPTVTLASGALTITHYGYDGDGPLLPAPGDLPSATHLVEASKTEPDKNTYLVLFGQTGADPAYDYGTHFLFQGHETGKSGYITRINLDADGPHRVTVMAAKDKTGAPLATIDGSTWDPFAQRLIFTTENTNGPEYQATLGFPSLVEDISGAIGRGGYEGVQNDSAGNLWIVEDVGGSSPAAAPHAKVPNSFVYRFVPRRNDDLTRGKLQVLQVISLRTESPIAFHGADADTLSMDVADLHTYGKVFDTKWVTIHDTDVDGSAPFNANALAKTKMGTPFKRPENGAFRPGSGFKEFFFDETGDTNSLTEAGAAFGGFGGIMKLTQTSPTANTGKLSLFFLGDVKHSGLDNCAFLSKNQVVFVEDAGDGLHTQRNALDSAWSFDVTLDYSNPANQPALLVAEGRDPSATLDSGFSGMPGFNNEGDNEITGFHVSNGDPSTGGIMGALFPKPFKSGWRVFYTQQHGDNVTWEILA
ncbi:MAG TPA: hypothetical protein VNO55_31115, partial [Polyangia bacterium]|nr:hypothetical protein [Polyangia bacterium]